MEEKAKLEKKFEEHQERLKNINLIKESSKNPMTAKELFSLAKPEIQKDIDNYTKAEMEPFTYEQDKGGRKSRKYRRRHKPRKSRKHRKSRKQ